MFKVFMLLVSLASPMANDWICWFTSTSNQECGTYGYSKNKEKAKEVSKELCEKQCGPCKLDYCEKLR
jgi:hypothetical protein